MERMPHPAFFRCCCGKRDCAYLEHNNLVLSELERDVATSAQLGQALLSRHESYMLESEAERANLSANAARLEHDKRHLEGENAGVVQENTELLRQLEGTNAQIADSDARIASLAATLGEARRENQRLTVLAARTEELERLVAEMEVGRAGLMEELEEGREEGRDATRRWRDAERRLGEVGEQVLRIEREARDEREKHMEMMGQVERRRAAQRELEGAAGRVNAAAAGAAVVAGILGSSSRETHRDMIGNGTNIISHFVRDVLQDNANLQVGIVELRGLLQASNDEVQSLREQVLTHQPVSTASEQQHALQPVSLMDEIQQSSAPKAVSPEVHVHHHHYHARIMAKKESRSSFRRPPRRRGQIVSSTSNSNSSLLGCQTPVVCAALDAMSMPRCGNRVNHHSTQSSATDFSAVSSLPSSPHSHQRTSSIFDRIELGFESSRPTSPESADFISTSSSSRIRFGHQRNITDLTNVSEDEPSSKSLESSDYRQSAEMRRRIPIVHDLDSERGVSLQGLAARQAPFEISKRSANALDEFRTGKTGLRRSSSHESLLSISGMDIHLAQHRNGPLHLLPKLPPAGVAPDPSNLSIAFAPSQPLASVAEVNARSSDNHAPPSAGDCPTPVSLLSGLAVGRSSQPRNKGLGRLVGKWVGGRLGVGPVALTGNLREQAASSDSMTRMPGINQKGPIVGWQPLATTTPSQVHAEVLDEGLLRESLAE